MHDIRFIRQNAAAFDKGLESRSLAPASERLIALDDRRKAAIFALQQALERRNALSKEIGQAKAKRDEARAQALMAEVASLKEDVPRLEEEEREALRALDEALAIIPNLPKPEVPVGPDESANVERHRVGETRQTNWARQHFEIGEALGQMDFETAAKLSGSRFVVLKSGLARLERALGQFMIDLHTNEHGYTEVAPPLLVRDEVMFGTAQLPKFRDDQFVAERTLTRAELLAEALNCHTEEDRARFARGDVDFVAMVNAALERAPSKEDFWLIPTAEVPLTNLVREKILDEAELPIRVAALTPCFRAEAGSAGRDTRGMLRQHQFVKCELVSIATPDASADEHERMLVLRGGGAEEARPAVSHGDALDRRHGFCVGKRPTTSRSGCRGRAPIARSPRCSVCTISRPGA